jgi:hypothetical protein
MADELHETLAVSVREVIELRNDLVQHKSLVRDFEHKVTEMTTEIRLLRDQVSKEKANADYHFKVWVEMVRQINNIEMFCADAIRSAREEVGKELDRKREGKGVEAATLVEGLAKELTKPPPQGRATKPVDLP